MPWDGGLVAINSFGFGGANAHIILESNTAPPSRPAAASTAPRLVIASGRHEEAVHELLSLAAKNKESADLHALLDTIHRQNIVGHPCRGYSILTDPPVEECIVSNSAVKTIFYEIYW